MAHLQTKLISHQQRILRLYKAALRELENWYPSRHLFRYQAVLMRQRFDVNRNEKDLIKSKQLLLAGEQELTDKRHPQPMKFPYSKHGISYGREGRVADGVLDHWHPLEKAQYPAYFARREQRKQEYVERWHKKYGDVHVEEHH